MLALGVVSWGFAVPIVTQKLLQAAYPPPQIKHLLYSYSMHRNFQLWPWNWDIKMMLPSIFHHLNAMSIAGKATRVNASWYSPLMDLIWFDLPSNSFSVVASHQRTWAMSPTKLSTTVRKFCSMIFKIEPKNILEIINPLLTWQGLQRHNILNFFCCVDVEPRFNQSRTVTHKLQYDDVICWAMLILPFKLATWHVQ